MASKQGLTYYTQVNIHIIIIDFDIDLLMEKCLESHLFLLSLKAKLYPESGNLILTRIRRLRLMVYEISKNHGQNINPKETEMTDVGYINHRDKSKSNITINSYDIFRYHIKNYS